MEQDTNDIIKLAEILVEKEKVDKKIEQLKLNQRLRNERKNKSK